MVPGEALQHLRLVRHLYIDAIDKLDRILPPRIIAPPHHDMAQQLPRFQAQPLANGGWHRPGRMVEGPLQSGKAPHANAPKPKARSAPAPVTILIGQSTIADTQPTIRTAT